MGSSIREKVSLSSCGNRTLVSLLMNESKGTGPIFIVEPPRKLEFLNTYGAVINCLVHGDPIPKVQWVNKNGQNVEDIHGLLKKLENNSLSLPKFDNGLYRQNIHATIYVCKASNKYGTIISREIQVTAVVDQQYSTQVYDEYVIEGNTALLKCIIPSYIKDQIIVTAWIRDDGVRISSEYQQDSRYLILNTGDLNIFNVRYGDSNNVYKCQTKHTVSGEVKPSSGIQPRIVYSTPSMNIVSGSEVTLSSVAQGFPAPAYSWCYQKYRGLSCEEIAKSTEKTIVGNSLIIRASMKDSGFYVCKAENKMGDDTVKLKLTVFAPLSAFIHPQRQIVDIGQAINIGCVISGGPFTFIKWFKDGKFLKEDVEQLNSSKSSLDISNVEKTTEGMYQCFVGNVMDEKQAIGQIILSAVPPTIVKEFKIQHKRPGQSLTLECAATGDPLPQIQWTLRDSIIKNSFGLNIESKVERGKIWSKLTIKILQIFNGGIYKCIAKNKAGNDIYSNTIHVYGPPRAWPLMNQTVVTGKSVFMQCHVSGYPIASINWKKDDEDLLENERIKIYSNGSLKILSAIRDIDSGKYKCTAENEEGYTSSGSGILRILVAPILNEIHDQSLRFGRRLGLYCSLTAGDPPIEFTWLYNGQALPHHLGLVVSDSTYLSTLSHQNIRGEHMGNYTCIAKNNAGSASVSAFIKVEAPPEWLMKPTSVEVHLGESISLPCTGKGFPQPKSTWLKLKEPQRKVAFLNSHGTVINCLVHGEPTPTVHWINKRNELVQDVNQCKSLTDAMEERLIGSSLILTPSDEDSGFYVCVAANEMGKETSTVKLTVFEFFRIPSRMTYKLPGFRICPVRENTSITTCFVTWKAEVRAIPFFSYLFELIMRNCILFRQPKHPEFYVKRFFVLSSVTLSGKCSEKGEDAGSRGHVGFKGLREKCIVSNKEMKTNSELPVLQTAVIFDSEDVAEEDNLDKEVDLVELMAASSRICSKRAKSLKRSKQQREVESSLALLEHPSNSYGRQVPNELFGFSSSFHVHEVRMIWGDPLTIDPTLQNFKTTCIIFLLIVFGATIVIFYYRTMHSVGLPSSLPLTHASLNQNKAHVFAQAYLNRVYETLCQSQDLDRYEKFLKLLSDFRIGDSMSTVMLFKTVKTLFAQHEHLVDEFVGFLLPEEALECGVLAQYLHISKMKDFFRKLEASVLCTTETATSKVPANAEFIEIMQSDNKLRDLKSLQFSLLICLTYNFGLLDFVHFSKNPQYLQKILRVLSQFQSQTDFTSSDLKSAVVPLLRGQAHLIDEFLSLIPDLQPPESLMTDFEEINLSDQEVNSDEDFELLTLPETQDKYGTKECPCVCHTNTHTARYINRIAHCASCGTKFIDGRVYLQVGKLLKPAKITYHSAINSTKCKNLTSPVLNSETPANETSSTSRTATELKLATDDMKAKLTVENQKDSISPPSSSSSSVSHSKETSKRRNFNLNTKNGTNIASTTPLKVDTCDTSFQSVMSSPPTDKVQFQIPNVNDSDNVTLSSSGKLQDFSRIFNSDQNKPALNVKITNTSNLTSSKLFPQTKMVTRKIETIASKVQILPTELCNNKSMKEMLCKDTDNSTSSEDLKGTNTLQINKRKSASTEVCESTKKQKSASEVCVTDSSSSSSSTSTSNSLISSDVWSK
ncbi:Down syndrome cell adhesion molecule-like protein Dscam2 [Nymphon striatum]|nr:Down syndrome cell adhesion molecule-like protein Dscam2 [Nymphon striatum]